MALQGLGPQAARLRGQVPPRVAPVAEQLQGVYAGVGSWLQGLPERRDQGLLPPLGGAHRWPLAQSWVHKSV